MAPVLPVLLALERPLAPQAPEHRGRLRGMPPRSHSLPAARRARGLATRAPNPPGGWQWVVGCWASGTNL